MPLVVEKRIRLKTCQNRLLDSSVKKNYSFVCIKYLTYSLLVMGCKISEYIFKCFKIRRRFYKSSTFQTNPEQITERSCDFVDSEVFFEILEVIWMSYTEWFGDSSLILTSSYLVIHF